MYFVIPRNEDRRDHWSTNCGSYSLCVWIFKLIWANLLLSTLRSSGLSGGNVCTMQGF